MIIDGKFIEENSIPLDRLMTPVVTAGDYVADAEALNTRISKIENLEMDEGTALQDFNTVANAHFATLINDESTESAPAHSIKLDTVTDAMLNSNLKDRVVYTDQVRTIAANDTFSGAVSFTGSTTHTGAADNTEVLKVTKGVTSLKNTTVGGNLNVTGASTLASLSVTGSVSISGGLTVAGTTTAVNSTNLNVQDRIITLNKGGTVPVAITAATHSGIDIDVNGYAEPRRARLVYKGDGWYIRNHSTTSSAQTESKIVTEAYLSSQGFQTTANLEAQIKTTMQKYIAMGNITLTGTTGVEVDLATKCATFAANITNGNNYDVFVTLVTPNTGNNGTTITAGATSLGEVQVVKTANKKFKIFNSGAASSGVTGGLYVHWVAINRAIATVAS